MNDTDLTALTADQLKSIRRIANRKGYATDRWLRVTYTPDAGYVVDVCERERFDGAVPGADEILREVRIPAKGHFSRYDSEGNNVRSKESVRVCATQTAYYSDNTQASAVRSIANVAKPGDSLHVKFVIGNSTDNLRKASLQQDEAYVSVVRKGQFVATFPVDVRIVPYGSLGSMLNSWRAS